MTTAALVFFLGFSLAITSVASAGNEPPANNDPVHISSAGQCPPANVDKLERKEMLHSQDGQDRCLIEHYFPGVCGGRYMEVGALDGDKYSNTFAFYNSPDLGWNGINVEVDPVSYSKLVKNRKNDLANVHAAVCSDPQIIHYATGKFKTVGGIWEFSSKEQRERWWPGVTLKDTEPVQCTHLQSIVDESLGHSNHYFDFLTLDIEGAELSGLQGLDFSKVGFGVLVIESQGRGQYGQGMDMAIEELLNSVGYDRVQDRAKTCGHRDNWYVNRNFDRIYRRFMPQAQGGQQRDNLRG